MISAYTPRSGQQSDSSVYRRSNIHIMRTILPEIPSIRMAEDLKNCVDALVCLSVFTVGLACMASLNVQPPHRRMNDTSEIQARNFPSCSSTK